MILPIPTFFAMQSPHIRTMSQIADKVTLSEPAFLTQFVPGHHTIPDQIAKAIAEHADATAFSDADLCLTYGDIAALAHALKADLPAHGPVAVFGKPSTVFGAATTACIVMGRPFVHLDPAMPTDVLANILAELETKTVLQCQPAKDGQLPAGCDLIDIPQIISERAPAPDGAIEAGNVKSDDAIYIVATSGTTGKPKCIPVTQEAAFLSYAWRDAYTPYAQGQSIGAYIFAIWEMFRPLRDGARICFPTFEQLLNPRELATFLIEHNISEMLFTPSALDKTLQASTKELMQNVPLKRIILNGEVVTDALIAAAQEKLPNATLWNLYSICETHDIAMTNVSETDRSAGAVGVAMPYLRPVILDDNDVPCPTGTPGLLHFEGPRMLGPGYVNRPQETALRFRNLTLDGQNTRLYDTGDQGFVDEDGMIHVLGRVAHMLKLRGHSIQTQDLTASLASFIGFQQAVPWIQDVAGQGNALVFYYAANAAQTTDNATKWGLNAGENRIPSALAKALRKALPAYCIPSYLVALPEIPINTVSGKCDFKALPKVADAQAQTTETDTRATVSEAAKALGCTADMIDPSLSFHDLGGDSLMAVTLVLALETAYGRRVDFDFALNVPLDRLHNILTEPMIAPKPDSTFDTPGILLTGATGFLGRHVLTAAAKSLPDDQVIYCLVRPKRRDATDRMRDIANDSGVPMNRVRIITAALEDPQFGLPATQYQSLCDATQSVVHCAAMVNLAVDRDTMEDWSKDGMENILQFCKDAQADLRFSSTSAAFPDTGGRHAETATYVYDNCGGYGAAKIAAEALIAASGIPATIVRLPSLYSITQPNPNDIYETIMTACHAIHAVPEGLMFRMIDVQHAAQFLAEVEQTHGAQTYNLTPDIWATAEVTDYTKLPVQTWLDKAPLSDAQKALIAADLSVLHADATLSHEKAQAAWQAISDLPFDHISDPTALLNARFGRDAVLTKAIPR